VSVGVSGGARSGWLAVCCITKNLHLYSMGPLGASNHISGVGREERGKMAAGRDLMGNTAGRAPRSFGSSSTPRIAPGSVIGLVSRLYRKSSEYVTEKV
jgi:hypothetical protein